MRAPARRAGCSLPLRLLLMGADHSRSPLQRYRRRLAKGLANLPMPELPEVETVRRGLAPVMEGAVIDKVEQRRPDLRMPFPPASPGG